MTNQEAIERLQRCKQNLELGKIIGTVSEEGADERIEAYDLAIKALEDKSYAQGEWYYNYQNGWHCSKCGKQVKEMPIDDNRKALYIFCPWCGEKMKHDTKQ